MTINSYPKVWHWGAVPLIDGPDNRPFAAGNCLVQEKVDGSQISFGLIDGELSIRSKNTDITDGSNSMFLPAIEAIRSMDLTPEVVYRGECLTKPKHNTLKYHRTPASFIALFDAYDSLNNLWATPKELHGAADALGCDAVPTLHVGPIDKEKFGELLETESFLGGPKIEGIVIKRYDMLTKLYQPAFAKFVSADFKEQHTKSWRERNPGSGEFLEELGAEFRNPARFRKAVERARDAGTLTNSPKDIGPLMKDLSVDFEQEWTDELSRRLWEHYRKTIMASANRGFAEWYKLELAEGAWAAA